VQIQDDHVTDLALDNFHGSVLRELRLSDRKGKH